MNLEEETYHEIDRFLLGELTEVEEVAFKARMESDPELKRAVELEADVNRAIQQDGRIDLKGRLQKIDLEMQSTDREDDSQIKDPLEIEDGSVEDDEHHFHGHDHHHEPRKGFPWLAVAASILLLLAPLALFQLYMAGSGPSDMVRLAIAEAQPQLDRGSIPDLLKESLSAFDKDEYDKAEEALLAYESQVPGEDIKPSILQYHGLILLRQDRPEEAEPFLQKAVDTGNDDYKDKYWLLILSLYQQGKMQPCLEALNKYIDEGQTSSDPKIQDHLEIAQDLREAILEELVE